MRSVLPAFLTLLLLGCASTPAEEDPVQVKLNELEARVAQLERIIANQDPFATRGREPGVAARAAGPHRGTRAQQRGAGKQQHDLYADLDKRLGGNGTAPVPGAPGAAAAGTAAGAAAGTAAAGAMAPADSGPSSTEQAVYAQAFDALKAGSYSLAITGFKDFLTTYPQQLRWPRTRSTGWGRRTTSTTITSRRRGPSARC